MACAESLPGGGFVARLAADRLHLQHGPIDIIVSVDADAGTTQTAFTAASNAFDPILSTLVGELPLLRQPVNPLSPGPVGPIAAHMVRSVSPFSSQSFVTPMAAVAGAVADHLLAIVKAVGVRRVLINNGGDIAIHLSPGSYCRIGVCTHLARPRTQHMIRLHAGDGVGGIATSGWPGRSRSLGIADAVTVLAADSATADAAATLIANAVNIDSPRIVRQPASALDEASDLGDRPVTVAVGELSPCEIDTALERGLELANAWRDAGLIRAAWLHLRDRARVCLPAPEHFPPDTQRGRSTHDYCQNPQARHRGRGNASGSRSRDRTADPARRRHRDHCQSVQRQVSG